MIVYENGIYRDLTEAETAENQAIEFREQQHHIVTDEDRLKALLATVVVSVPEGGSVSGDDVSLPFKAGFRWEKICTGGSVSFKIVEDPSAIGSMDNPIIYNDSVQMIEGAFYMKDGTRQIFMGGQFVEW